MPPARRGHKYARTDNPKTQCLQPQLLDKQTYNMPLKIIHISERVAATDKQLSHLSIYIIKLYKISVGYSFCIRSYGLGYLNDRIMFNRHAVFNDSSTSSR